MKCVLIALVVVLGVASAQFISPYGVGLVHPYAYGAHYAAAPHYAAPLVAAPAIQTGYVAATRGSLHTAPLPEGPFAVSHHINTAPAPGTF